jgi:hypothetical protein
MKTLEPYPARGYWMFQYPMVLRLRLGFWVMCAWGAGFTLQAQSRFWIPDSLPNPRRQVGFGVAFGVGTVATYTALGAAWYANTPMGGFRWFDDWHEWQQMDKLGHSWSAYQVSRNLGDAIRWTGASRKQVLLYGTLAGFVFQTPIEVFDGFSPKYGASWGDITANAAGSLLYLFNETLWREQRIGLAWSFWLSPYAAQRPDVLGTGLTQALKDYNGQIYWLTLRVHSFLPEGRLKSWYPRWLGLAVGYGADSLLGGYGIVPPQVLAARERRQFYVSIHPDLANIRTRHRGLRILFSVLSCVKLPFPALEYTPATQRLRFNAIGW